MMGLRKVRNEVTTVRKEGVARNGTEKVIFFPPISCQRHPVRFLIWVSIFDNFLSQAKVLEDASLTWAIVEMAGLASYFTKLQAFTPSFAAATASSSPLDTK